MRFPPRLDRVYEHTFVPGLLPANPVILDLGGNRGVFSQKMGQKYGARCYTVEASPVMFETIPESPSLRKFHLAVAAKNGPIVFHLTDNPECSSIIAEVKDPILRKVEVEGITLEALMDRLNLERVDLLKMDIEGAEFEVLSSAPDAYLRRVGQLTLEFHAGLGGTTQDIRRVIRRMRKIGFVAACMSVRYYTDMLFVNRSWPGASSLSMLSLVTIKRPGVYARRVLNRMGLRVQPEW